MLFYVEHRIFFALLSGQPVYSRHLKPFPVDNCLIQFQRNNSD